jgi:CHAD domain-containing protein
MKRKAPEPRPIAIRKFAGQQAAAYLRRFAFEVNRAAKLGNADAIHDLRVSSRRLAECLRVFGQFFSARAVRKIRRSLKTLLAQAAEVRNRDITRELLVKAGVGSGSAALTTLDSERERELRLLADMLKHWTRRHSFRKWRAQIEM